MESSFLSAEFKNQTVDSLKMWPETPGTMTPLYLAKKSLFYLPQFRWFEPLRPTSPDDVFNISYEMLQLMQEPPFGGRNSGSGNSKSPARNSAMPPAALKREGVPTASQAVEPTPDAATPAEDKATSDTDNTDHEAVPPSASETE